MQAPPLLLLVDDDPAILESLSIHLGADGYRVATAQSGQAALDLIRHELPAVAIVDLMMPGMDGFETSRRLKRHADVPIVVLTAVNTDAVKVRAIQLYADDYVTKPFSYAELAARLGRIIRRAWPSGPPSSLQTVDDDLVLDFALPAVLVKGESRRLSPTEARLLQLLYTNAGRVLPNELILDRVWPDAEGEMSYLWEYVRRLREKLSDDPAVPRYIASERGIGYRFLRSPLAHPPRGDV